MSSPIDLTGLSDKVVKIFSERGKEALDVLSAEDRTAALNSVALMTIFQARLLAGDKTAEELLRREGRTLRAYRVIGAIQLDRIAADALRDVFEAALGVGISLLVGAL